MLLGLPYRRREFKRPSDGSLRSSWAARPSTAWRNDLSRNLIRIDLMGLPTIWQAKRSGAVTRRLAGPVGSGATLTWCA